jgi:hypothetical protein
LPAVVEQEKTTFSFVVQRLFGSPPTAKAGDTAIRSAIKFFMRGAIGRA